MICCAKRWSISRKPNRCAHRVTTMPSCDGTPARASSSKTSSLRARKKSARSFRWSNSLLPLDHDPAPDLDHCLGLQGSLGFDQDQDHDQDHDQDQEQDVTSAPDRANTPAVPYSTTALS